MSITFEPTPEGSFEVTVRETVTTTHRVSIADDYWRKLTNARASKEDLLRASFAFLLEREPNTSILSQFDLPLIQNYFPEYESEMRSRFG